MDLQMKYHYYTMCTLQDMDLNQELNQSVMDGQTDGWTVNGNIIYHVHIRDWTMTNHCIYNLMHSFISNVLTAIYLQNIYV